MMPRKVSPEPPNEEIQRYSRIHGLGQPWPRPLEFPKEGKKRTTVYWKDLERLDEGEFLNDNLIAFYLLYLEIQAERADPMTSRKVYMFNTFFYERLTSTKDGHKGINYNAVRKWTREVDLFTYDFVVVPVNESAHWYVAIICNLPALQRKLGGFDDELGQGLASAGEDDSERATKDGKVSSSSPQRPLSDAGTGGGAFLSKDLIADPKEQEAAASFAEMSLEAKEGAARKQSPGLDIPGTFHSDGADQQMLDDQLQTPVEKVVDGQAEASKKTEEEDEEVIKTEEVTPSKSKAGKRKSMPSPRTFDPHKPTILTFDSFGHAHPATVRILKQYLHEEANDKRGHMEFDEKGLQGVTAKRIPQQDNFCDCGLFLLGYMEKFFKNPREFINKIMRIEWDLKTDWAQLDPSKMRTKIREILLGLEQERRQDMLRAKRERNASKSEKVERSSPPKLVDKTRSSDNAGKANNGERNADKPPAKAPPEAPRQTTPSTRKAALESARNIGEPIQQDASDANSTSSKTAAADKEPVVKTHPPPPTALEQPPQSFIVLDSQSQPANTVTSSKPPESYQDPKALAISLICHPRSKILNHQSSSLRLKTSVKNDYLSTRLPLPKAHRRLRPNRNPDTLNPSHLQYLHLIQSTRTPIQTTRQRHIRLMPRT